MKLGAGWETWVRRVRQAKIVRRVLLRLFKAELGSAWGWWWRMTRELRRVEEARKRKMEVLVAMFKRIVHGDLLRSFNTWAKLVEWGKFEVAKRRAAVALLKKRLEAPMPILPRVASLLLTQQPLSLVAASHTWPTKSSPTGSGSGPARQEDYGISPLPRRSLKGELWGTGGQRSRRGSKSCARTRTSSSRSTRAET